MLIPRISDTNLLAQAMDRVDALLLTGGIKGQDYPNRIEFEKLLMGMAIERGLPILGFCHGHQCINLYFGGTIMPVPKDRSPSIVHRGKDPPYVKDCFHMINVKPGSRLADGFGTTRMEVNTSHTMCVKDVGEGLDVIARSDDGVVEAIEHRTLPITGFQFHPERIFRRDPRYLRIIADALERGRSKENQ
jgi:putative glutamine amidotransferase